MADFGGGNKPTRARTQAPLTGQEIRGEVGGVLPVYRRSHGAAGCRSGDSLAEIGVNGAACYIGASNLIPGFLPPLLDNRSYGNCRSAIVETGAKWTVPALEIALCQSAVAGRRECVPKLGIRAGHSFSPRPRPPLAAWARLRTGPPDAAGGLGRSSGPGCAAHAAPSLAARRSRTAIPASPSPGDWSMVSAPTRSPPCGLPRLIGARLSQESVHNRNAE